jgi:two-component system sensor histidine kinase/response regulator
MNKNDIILCVDDDKIILHAMMQQLSTCIDDSVTIELCESGDEALEVLEELMKEGYNVPIVVTDQMMNGMNGDELITIAKDKFPEVKFILLTGYSRESFEKLTELENLEEIVIKPWERDDLKRILSKFYPTK